MNDKKDLITINLFLFLIFLLSYVALIEPILDPILDPLYIKYFKNVGLVFIAELLLIIFIFFLVAITLLLITIVKFSTIKLIWKRGTIA
ncbi:hypothetical protein ACFFIX_19690 [Metabacillus herbersteinensis]|uniref:Uncharacterized protein n=1 Tax=Metabacillus herbersteinensis TaxID=283816 RepID=A0ABV6GIV5_9BACI